MPKGVGRPHMAVRAAGRRVTALSQKGADIKEIRKAVKHHVNTMRRQRRLRSKGLK